MKLKKALNNKVFLGGTCNDSKWRETIIPLLKINYFNPVVKNWTEEAQKEELKQREECSFVLYTITPLMTGVYSIAEVIDDSNKRPHKTIFVTLPKDGDKEFTPQQLKSLKAVGDMVTRNGGETFNSLEDAANYLNNMY